MKYNLDGIEFELTHEDAIGSAHVFNRGRPEANDLGLYGHVREMESFIRQTEHLKTFLDVGACMGIFSLIFTRNAGTRAFAVEPSPWAYPILVNQCLANPGRKITPLSVFAGEVTGREIKCARDWRHVVADNNSGEAWQKKYHGKPLSKERATMAEIRLDDLPEARQIDCMKIDVEGWECHVLRGARELILRQKPVIFLECHVPTLEGLGESPGGLFSLVTGMGYRIENADGEPVNDLTACSIMRVTCKPL